jgi:hypothetical protein
MSKTLGGIVFCIDPIKYDYCILESIACLSEMCDKVIVLDAGSEDGSIELLKTIESENVKVIYLERGKYWDQIRGKEKLSFFQNMALEHLDTDYYYLQQADEVTSEKSFPAIREAMETGFEAFMITRHNLWGNCNSILNVEHHEQPCSTKVIRLAKTTYPSVDDGESVGCPYVCIDYVNEIVMYHYGFVRKKEVMKDKIINMQESVFEISHDKKLDGMDVFDYRAWHDDNSLIPITGEHPKFIQEWIKTRP